MRVFLLLVLVVLVAPMAQAATYYVDPTAGACSGTYSIVSRNCSGSDGTSFASPSAANAGSAVGDTLIYRAGTYSTTLTCGSMSCVIPLKASSATSARTTLRCYTGDVCEIKPGNSVYPIQRSGVGNYTFTGFKFNGINGTTFAFGLKFNNSEPGIWFLENEITNMRDHGIVASGNDWIIRNNHIHHLISDCVAGNRYYAVYFRDGERGLIEYNEFDHTPGGGGQYYPGTVIPIRNLIVRYNYYHDNNECSTSGIGGAIVGGNNLGAKIYGNIFANNGSHASSGANSAMMVQGGADNAEIINNTFYNNRGYGVLVQTSGSTGTIIKNNFFSLNTNGSISDAGTGTVQTTNISNSNPAVCLTDAANSNFRLKAGTNSCRDVGTADASRPIIVGTTDVGAFEQGTVASAVVASTYIEVTVNVMTRGVKPTSGCTEFTVANGTSTGTPVVDACSVKPTADNVILLTISGFTASGTCTVSYSGGNVRDSSYIGLTSSDVTQTINSASGVSVSGTCDNSAGGTPPAGSLQVHHTMNEGTGTSLNDETANNLDSTLSGPPTWVATGVEGASLYFANDDTDKRVTFTYGTVLNPTANSFTFCAWVKVDSGLTNKLIMGPPSGTNQRMYLGIHNSASTWGIGVGSSTISGSSPSEFAVSTTWQRTCVVNDAATDTVTLAVDGVKGTSAAAVKSSASVTDLAGDFIIGCGIVTGTSYCGGWAVDDVKIWTKALSAAELLEDLASYSPPGASAACYKQQDFQAQRVRVDGSSNPVNYLSAGTSSIPVMAGGAVAIVMQVDCVGSAGPPLAMRWMYAKNAGDFSLAIPSEFGADGIAFFGNDTSPSLNSGAVSDCVSGVLTENYGPTQLDSGASPTIQLSQNHSYCIRGIIRFNTDQAGNYFQLRLGQDNGAVLSGGYTATPRFDVIAPQANSGP